MAETAATTDTIPDLGTLPSGKLEVSRPPPELTEIQREKGAATSAALTQSEQRAETDRGYMTDRFRAMGVEAEKLRPWDYEKEQEKHHTSPLEAFGSFASVFGILASSFTHAPMENALNASAAAMTAIRSNDDKEYERAFSAYKNNMDLVKTRHDMMQTEYQDAIALMKTDLALGEVKAKNIATRFGDKQTLVLLENGMSKEWFEAQEAKNKAVAGAFEATNKMDDTRFRHELMKADPHWAQADANQRFALFKYYQGINTDPEKEIVRRFIVEHDKDPDLVEKTLKLITDIKHRQPNPPLTTDRLDAIEIDRRQKQYQGEGMKPNEAFDKAAGEVRKLRVEGKQNLDQTFAQKWWEDHPEGTVEEFSEAAQAFKRNQKRDTTSGANKALTVDRQIAADVDKYREGLKTSINPDTGEKYTDDEIAELAAKRAKKLRAEATPATGNQRDLIRSSIDRTVRFEETIDKVEGLLAKHNALTGLGGKVTRPLETVGNWFGSNETDRKQFERYLAELKEWSSRILNESRGRPLAAEAANVDTIVAGLRMGDTTANTVRAYRELKPLIQKIRADLEARESGTWVPPEQRTKDGPGGSTKDKPPPEKWWLNDKPAGKRSDVGGPVMSDVDPDYLVPGARYAQLKGDRREVPRTRSPGYEKLRRFMTADDDESRWSTVLREVQRTEAEDISNQFRRE